MCTYIHQRNHILNLITTVHRTLLSSGNIKLECWFCPFRYLFRLKYKWYWSTFIICWENLTKHACTFDRFLLQYKEIWSCIQFKKGPKTFLFGGIHHSSPWTKYHWYIEYNYQTKQCCNACSILDDKVF